jgi:hypothetical protein
LLRYNARIVVLNSYWLFVAPLVTSQLIIFWYMAMESLTKGSAVFVAQTTELIAPIFAAFLCAHVLAPEYRYRLDDLVFSRPVSFGRTVMARLLTMYLFLAVLIAVMLFVYRVGLKADYSLQTVVLAGLPSVLFLSMLSLAVAGVWRSPVAGVGVAGTVWVADMLVGARANPLVNLHSYTAKLLAEDTTSAEWLVSKVVLVVTGVGLAVVASRAVGRPAGPIRWHTIGKLAAAAGVLLLCYVASGAAYKVYRLQAMEADPELLMDVRRAHQDAFMIYNRIPVAYLFGGAYASYIGYPVHRGGIFQELQKGRQRVVDQLSSVVFGHPDSPWADNAFFELIRTASAVTEEGRELKGGQQGEVIDRTMAQQYCRQFLRDYPQSPFAPLVAEKLMAVAASLKDETTQREAFQVLVSSYADSPVTLNAARTLAMVYLGSGRTTEAVEVAESALQGMSAAGGRPESLLALGDLLRAQAHPESARLAYEQALRVANAALEKLRAKQVSFGDMDERYTRDRGQIRSLAGRAQTALNELAAQP